MRGTTTFVLFLVTLFIKTSGTAAAQPPRLWAYARYEFLSPTDSQLVELGRFTYSGGRGLAVDSTGDFLPFYYLFLNLPNDFSQLNKWFVHRHQPLPQRVVAQFDSFRSWDLYDPWAPPQPNYVVAKTHTGNRLDSLVVSSAASSAVRSWAYDYDAQAKPIACRVWASTSAASGWYRVDGMRLIRNAASQPLERRRDYFTGGVNSETLISTYYYNGQAQLDSLNTVDSVASGVYPTEREHFGHDALGRLRTWSQYSYNSSGNFWMYHGRDSFNYNGTSARYATNYRVSSASPAYFAHGFNYDSQGRVAEYYDGNPRYIAFQRNAAGLVTQTTDTYPNTSLVKTYFYYDSTEAANFVAPLGVGNTASNRTMPIGVYPNPAQNEVFVRSEKELSGYKLYSVTGQEVQSGKLTGIEASVSLKQLSPGVYLLHIKSVEGTARTVRVVKR